MFEHIELPTIIIDGVQYPASLYGAYVFVPELELDPGEVLRMTQSDVTSNESI